MDSFICVFWSDMMHVRRSYATKVYFDCSNLKIATVCQSSFNSVCQNSCGHVFQNST